LTKYLIFVKVIIEKGYAIMICDKCGAQLDNSAEFCWACGNKVEKKVDDNIDENLINKYKNNISFFNLSNDDTTKKEEVTNPFVFPKNIFNEPLNDNNLMQEEKIDSSNNDINLNQDTNFQTLDNSPIFPENTDVNLNQDTNFQALYNSPIFPDSISNTENTDVNLNQDTNFQTLDNSPIFPDSISNTENTDVNLNQDTNFQTLDNSPIFLDNMPNTENTTTNLNQDMTTNNNIDYSTIPDNQIINEPILPENNVQNSELNQTIQPEQQPIQNVETTNLETNNANINNGPINNVTPKENTNNNKEKKKTNNSIIVFVAIAFIIFIVLAILLTGNDSKEITCVQNETENGLTSETTLKAAFKNNKIKSLTISGNYVVSNEYISHMDKFYETVKEELKKYSGIKGTEVTTNNDSNTITYNVTSTDSKALFKATLNKNSETAEDFTNAAEEQGYECTINKN